MKETFFNHEQTIVTPVAFSLKKNTLKFNTNTHTHTHTHTHTQKKHENQLCELPKLLKRHS